MNELTNGVTGHGYILQGYTGLGTTWANDMNELMNGVFGHGSVL